MPYYHVRVTRKSHRTDDALELDLSEKELQEQIVERFLQGRAFMCGGQPIPPSDVETIRINVTEKASKDLIPIIAERRRRTSASSGIVVPISDKWYVTKEGEDVTRKYLKFPSTEPEKTKRHKKELNTNIFIVHGTDHIPVKELKAILIEVGLNPIILYEQPS